jgi:hypothetical protein
MNPPEPVAVIHDVFELRWIGSGPIEPLVRRNNLKVGDKLYGPQVAARLEEIEAMLPELLDAISEGWQDIHELIRVAKHNLEPGTLVPMKVTDNGIAQSETVIANLKAAGRKLRMWQEGVTEEDLFIPESERP